MLCLDALVLLPALVQAGGEHEAVEVGAAHAVLVQRTQLNRVQIQVAIQYPTLWSRPEENMRQ